MTSAQNCFLSLTRLGIGQELPYSKACFNHQTDWNSVLTIASEQGLLAIVLDGLEKLPVLMRPPKDLLLPWIGLGLKGEIKNSNQWNAACILSKLLAKHGIKTYILKGVIIAECYPIPKHRTCVDLDCFLCDRESYVDAWEYGNTVVETAGYKVERDYYKHSSWYLPGLTVENHKFLTPFRGNKKLASLERVLQHLICEDNDENRVGDVELYKPPVMVTSLFLIEHAYSHFLHEGLTWKHVLDWMMFSRKHKSEIDWVQLENMVDKFGFRKFYDSFYRLGVYLLGEVDDKVLARRDLLMLNDIWSDLDLHDTVKGWRGKLNIVGNTWRARWKYRLFTETTWLHALWIQVKGFFFFANPKL